MPIGNPTPFRREMYNTSVARSTYKFRVDRFMRQYFLSGYELEARGYQKIPCRPGCNCAIRGGFDGFASANDCTITITKPRPTDGSPRPAPQLVMATCMIPPVNRVSLEVDSNPDTFCFVNFWSSRSKGAVGSSVFSPDVLMMQMKHFAFSNNANRAATQLLLSDICVEVPSVTHVTHPAEPAMLSA